MAFSVSFRNARLEGAKGDLVSLSLHSASPAAEANEIAGTRTALAWSAVSNGSMSASVSAPVGAGSTVAAVGFWNGDATPTF